MTPTAMEIRQYDLLVDGQWRPAASGDYFAVENPATGATVARMANAGPEEVAAAVAAAEQAFRHGPWATMPDADRGKILWRMADLVEERRMELGPLGIPVQRAADCRNFRANAGGSQLFPLLLPAFATKSRARPSPPTGGISTTPCGFPWA